MDAREGAFSCKLCRTMTAEKLSSKNEVTGKATPESGSVAVIPYKNPLLWVPTSYFAMGTVYITVSTASNIMFSNLGLSNDQAAAYSSLTGFAFTFKPFWAPLLELYKTKKFFVIAMQLVLAVVFAGLAFLLPFSGASTAPLTSGITSAPLPLVLPIFGLLMVAAVTGATQDIVSDGVYVTTLNSKNQAKYTGVQSMCWNIGFVVAGGLLVMLVGRLAGETSAGPKPAPASYGSAWTYVFVACSALMLLLAGWHTKMLPHGSRAQNAPRSLGEALETVGKAFVTFFQKKDILLLLAFAFFYRSGLGLLDKIAPLFLIGSRSSGGLGLDNTTLGWMNGIVGTTALVVGSILGGWFVSVRGLKKSLLLLCLALNVPNITFLYLGWARPESLWTVGAVFFIEKLGWGFGSVGHMIYMMQQIAPGPYKTAHYAFATGLGLSFCMTATGWVSGYLQMAVGYQTYFVIALLAAIPSILFTILAPFHYTDDSAAGKS
jgi:PAT family beta-lactamase induction signal transducer AmpG